MTGEKRRVAYARWTKNCARTAKQTLLADDEPSVSFMKFAWGFTERALAA